MRTTRTIAVSIICMVSAGMLTCAADFPVLDGDRQATIVSTAEPVGYDAHAATDLAAYLKVSTGREFTVVGEDEFQPGAGLFPIYVGICQITREVLGEELAKLDRDGFMIVVEPDRVFLTGPGTFSAFSATCRFLEDYAGMRWLIPGPLGEEVPSHDRIVVSPVHRIEEPLILSRYWSGDKHARVPEGQTEINTVPSLKIGRTWARRQGIMSRYSFHHNLAIVFNPDRFYDDHPEYYALRDGQRTRHEPGSSQIFPCWTEPGTVTAAAQVACEAFDEDPKLEIFSLAPEDWFKPCQCERCQAMVRPDKNWGGYKSDYSDLYYSWVSKVAEEVGKRYPGKLLGTLAYARYIAPPEESIKLNRRIMPYMTFCPAHTNSPEYKKWARKLVEEWGKRVDQTGLYDYAYGHGFILPHIYTHRLQETVQHGYEHGVRGVYAEVYPNWGLDGPKLYLMARIWWNPYCDVDALFDDWNESMFHEAAEPMKKYFTRCEEVEEAYPDTSEGFWIFDHYRGRQFRTYTPAVIEELTGYLDEAARLAQDELIKQRIHFFRKTWDVGVIFANAYWAGEGVRTLIEQQASLEEIAAAMRNMPQPMELEDFQKLVEERLGDDSIAFWPNYELRKIPVPVGGGTTEAYEALAQRLISETVAAAREQGMLRGSALRRAIERRLEQAFGSEGSPAFRDAVAQIRQRALGVAGVVRLEQAPRIDGVVDDAAWSRADRLTDFKLPESTTPATYNTTAKLAHDGENLYVAVECRQFVSSLVAETKADERDGKSYEDDSVEIFLRSADRPETCAQFVINPVGALFDQWDDGTGKETKDRMARDFDCQWATKVYADRWTVELRLPLRELLVVPSSGARLRMNVVRNVVGGAGEVSTWHHEANARSHRALNNQGWAILE